MNNELRRKIIFDLPPNLSVFSLQIRGIRESERMVYKSKSLLSSTFSSAVCIPFIYPVENMSKYIPVKLAYKTIEPVSGAGDKSPIIFLHGVVTSKEYWSDIPQTVANASKRMVYLLDARNHGDSEWSDEFNFDINSDDLVHFMNTMNISKAVLLGHNMGGVTAIRTALRKEERVEMLIAEDTLVRRFPKPVLDMIITQLTMAQQAAEQMPSDVNEANANKFIFDFIYSHIPDEVKAVMKKRDIDEQRRLISLRRNPDGRYGFKSNLKVILNALKNTETLMAEPTGIYKGPAFFIYGEHSPFSVKAEEQEIRQFFPKAEFEAIKDASHAVHVDSPREFTDAVLKFLSRA